MKSKLLIWLLSIVEAWLLLLNLTACYSANVIKNNPLSKDITTINSNTQSTPINTSNGSTESNTNYNSPKDSPINPNVTITPSPIPSQGYSGSSGGYSGGGGVATPLTKEEIIQAKKTDVATKVISSFKGDKLRTLVLLKLFGFSTTDLQKAGYSKEDIDKINNESNPQASPSP